MRKSTKIWLVTATCLLLIGCIIFGGAMTLLKWDFRKLSTNKYETNIHEISEDFSNISINTNTADITFALSDDGKCKIVCYDDKKTKHSISVENDTLTIKLTDKKHWYDYIGINFCAPKINIYLPKSEYSMLSVNEDTGDIKMPKDFKFGSVDVSLSTGDIDFCASASESVKIKASTGKISVKNISATSLDLKTSTGNITAQNVKCEGDIKTNVSTGKTFFMDVSCKNLTSGGDTGDISLENVIATEKFSIKRSTGDIRFEDSDANEIFVTTDTGSVTGTLLSEKIFIANTDTGNVNVPKTTSGGRCEITTDTGNIKIKVR